jgi:hypothetical protein
MAYRFNGSSDKILFAAAPIIGYTSGPLTVAVYLKRTVLATNDDLVGVFSSGGSARCALYVSSGNRVKFDQNLGGSNAQTLSSTSIWYLVAATVNSSNVARDHVHDGTSWSHASGGTLGAGSFSSGDQIGVSHGGYAGLLAGDVVCAGIKKADSADVTIETLSRTDFSVWRSFGFDWLVGFDTSLQSAGVLQDQASPGTGDEVSKVGTSVVSDPPGWVWAAAAPASGFLSFT